MTVFFVVSYYFISKNKFQPGVCDGCHGCNGQMDIIYMHGYNGKSYELL